MYVCLFLCEETLVWKICTSFMCGSRDGLVGRDVCRMCEWVWGDGMSDSGVCQRVCVCVFRRWKIMLCVWWAMVPRYNVCRWMDRHIQGLVVVGTDDDDTKLHAMRSTPRPTECMCSFVCMDFKLFFSSLAPVWVFTYIHTCKKGDDDDANTLCSMKTVVHWTKKIKIMYFYFIERKKIQFFFMPHMVGCGAVSYRWNIFLYFMFFFVGWREIEKLCFY